MRVVPGVPVEGRAHASRRRLPQRRAAIALVVGVVLVVGGAVTVIAAALQTGSTADLRALDVDGTVSPAPKLPEVDQDTPTASGRPSDVLPGGLVVTAALGRRPRSRSSRPCTGQTAASLQVSVDGSRAAPGAAGQRTEHVAGHLTERHRTALHGGQLPTRRCHRSPRTVSRRTRTRLLTPIAYGAVTNLPITIDLAAAWVLNVYCPTAPTPAALLCGQLDGDHWTMTPPPGRPLVVAPLDLPPPTLTRGSTETGPGQRPPSIRSSACDPAVHASKSRTSRRIS